MYLDCSRFWECGPDYESCLFECAHCGGSSNPLCNDQQALSFDPSYNYPVGPVCDWPKNIDCTNQPGECDCLPWQVRNMHENDQIYKTVFPRPVLEGSASHNVRRTVTALVGMNAVTASGVRALPALQTLTVSMRCATLQQTPTLLANTVMPTR